MTAADGADMSGRGQPGMRDAMPMVMLAVLAVLAVVSADTDDREYHRRDGNSGDQRPRGAGSSDQRRPAAVHLHGAAIQDR